MRDHYLYKAIHDRIYNKIATFSVMTIKTMRQFVYQRQHFFLKHVVFMLKVLNSCPLSRKIPTFVSGFNNLTS